MKKTLATVAVLAFAGAASADTMYVDLTGFQSFTGYDIGGLNSEVFMNLGIGTEIVNVEFVDIQIEVSNGSYASEFTVSLNATDGVSLGGFWDSTIPGAPDDNLDFGPVSAPFDNPGVFGTGPFTMDFDDLQITVYEGFNDAGDDLDATVVGGGILITYNPVPTPGAAGLLGLAGIAAVRRRR